MRVAWIVGDSFIEMRRGMADSAAEDQSFDCCWVLFEMREDFLCYGKDGGDAEDEDVCCI